MFSDAINKKTILCKIVRIYDTCIVVWYVNQFESILQIHVLKLQSGMGGGDVFVRGCKTTGPNYQLMSVRRLSRR